MRKSSKRSLFFLCLLAASPSSAECAEPVAQSQTTNSNAESAIELQAPPSPLWQKDVGEGFRSTVQTLSLEAGTALGDLCGHRQNHDLALTSLSYGHMLGPVLGGENWYRGSFEWRVELFGGAQYSPSTEWLVGVAPHLRYNFATGTRWIPFLDAGVGATATGIGMPDLGGTFEFNLQSTVGMHWFVHDKLALTGELRYLHLSCAGIYASNRGVNDLAGMVGLTKFF